MKIIKIASTIIIACAVLFLSIGCSSEASATVKTQNYTVAKGSVSVSITGTGNLALSRTENLAFEMAGTVDQVLVAESETVTKGQELVKLDTSAWETQIKTLEKALVTAQRNLSAKEKALTTAERAVIAKETEVTTAKRLITSREVAVSQAELDLKTAEYNLSQIATVKKYQDTVDNAEYAIKFVNSVLEGQVGGGLGVNYQYWSELKTGYQAELTQAKADLKSVLSDTGITLSTEINLQIAKYQLLVTKAQMALEDAELAVDSAKSDVADTELAVDDAESSVTDARIAVDDAVSAVADAQDDLDEAKSLTPVITAPFDGFISNINIEGGDEVLKGTIALTIADPDLFSAKILVTEEDIFSVKLGGSATVSLTALSDYTFPATVTQISPTASVSSGVVNYSVTVNITSLTPITTTAAAAQMPAQSANRTMPSGTTPDFSSSGNFTPPSGAFQMSSLSTTATTQDISLKDGLSAVVEIVSQQKSNVLVVPSKAITKVSGRSTVQVVKENATETRIVVAGLTDGSYTEITSGLTEGEQVQIKSNSSSSSSSSSSSAGLNTQMQFQAISGGGQGGPPPGGSNMIQLENIIKSYPMGKRELTVLQGVNLNIDKGEMVAIMGPSGSGKSTLLNLIGLLDKPTSGSYLLDGKEVSNLSSRELARVRGQKIGFIFQSFNLLPYLSAIDNVELGQEYAGKEDNKVARDALVKVGLEDRVNHRPSELSGGEQQRVAVARALAKDPPIILADEPTGNLDSRASKEIMNTLSALHTEKNITLVMITHDPNIARYCQRIIHIEDGQVLSEEKL